MKVNRTMREREIDEKADIHYSTNNINLLARNATYVRRCITSHIHPRQHHRHKKATGTTHSPTRAHLSFMNDVALWKALSMLKLVPAKYTSAEQTWASS